LLRHHTADLLKSKKLLIYRLSLFLPPGTLHAVTKWRNKSAPESKEV
jgi:hypothetical protein